LVTFTRLLPREKRLEQLLVGYRRAVGAVRDVRGSFRFFADEEGP
jgi:hypothetical protein